ncbi:MAG TPA: M81 family metallopeptidase [Anaerolineae bacterium]|nr:M81 family metallopeptidase [Anaerolineae bacterium]HQH37639.1 M81 family metallopeptidase [Anaerolineae bacterium]
MKVLVGAIGHESNTFTPFLTRLEDFRPRYGQDTLAPPVRHGAFGGIVATLQARRDVTLVPSVTAHAMPGGVVERGAFETLKGALLEAAHDVDGACIFLHGAMRAEGVDYAENDILTALRARLGPDVPITVALDMHANIVAETAQAVDALVAYHTAPHDDAYETGVKAAEMLFYLLEGGCLTMGCTKIPFLLPGEKAETSVGAMREMMQLVAGLEAQPGIVSASLMNGHCWADVPDIGVSAVVVADNNVALAQTEADRLAAAFWDRRADFDFHTEAYPVDEAVRVAMTAPESTVFLSDSGDNPGAGGTTDVTVVLESLLRQGATNTVVAAIWDAESVAACIAAGVGREVSLSIGGKLDVRHSQPLPVTGVVRLISDGDYYWGGIREPGRLVQRGPIVVLTVEGVDVVLSANRLSIEEPEHLRSLGIEPLAYKIVVPKRGYLTTPLHVISPRSILAISPGVTNCDVRQLEYRRVQRPMYPLDEF